MPSFKATDATASKPAWLTTAEKTNCLGADVTETAASSRIMHQGWTVPAGGNDNASAQRETIACITLTSDVGAGDDSAFGIAATYVEWEGKTEFGNEAGYNNMTVGHYGGVTYHVTGGEWENYHVDDGGLWTEYAAGIGFGTTFTLRINDTTDLHCTLQGITPSTSAAALFVFNINDAGDASVMTAWIASVGVSVQKFSLYLTYQG